jgi:hypothetical protein
MNETDERSFSGLKAFDATMLFALSGADDIRVAPMEGNWCCVLGQSVGRESVNFYTVNRVKRPPTYDAKSSAGKEIAEGLASIYDIFEESFRPGVAARMGLDYESVAHCNHRIIYAFLSGFGQVGSNSQRPTVDGLIQAYSGVMVMHKIEDGEPYDDWLKEDHVAATQACSWIGHLAFGRLLVAHVPGILPRGDCATADTAPLLGQQSRGTLRERGRARDWIGEQPDRGTVRETVEQERV